MHTDADYALASVRTAAPAKLAASECDAQICYTLCNRVTQCDTYVCNRGVRLSATRLPYDLFPADEERDAQVLPGRPEGLGLPRRFEEIELRAAITHAKFLAHS